MKERKQVWKWLLIYTALFAGCFGVCYAGMLLSGHTPIWEVDGLMQHYPYFAYIGQWLRQAIRSLLTGEAVPMFDFALGFGEDVLVTANYYGLGDPLTLIAALFSGGATEWGFGLWVVLRVWCAGLACIALSRSMHFTWKQSLYSGLTYAFGLWLFAEGAIRQTMFLNPCIHFPLMILGMERVFEGEKPWTLSFAVLLAALGGFYFLYCSSVLLLIYALVRHFTRGTERPLRTLAHTAGRAMGWYLLGLGMAAVIFLPVTMGFLSGQRMGNVGTLSELRLHYSLRDYLRIPLALVSARGMGATPFVPALTLLGGALLVLRHRKEDRSWLWLIGVTAVMLLIPATGWALNGFSYETTRWSYAPALLACMVGGKMLDEILQATRREKIFLAVLGGLALAYLAVMALTGLGGSRMTIAVAMVAVAATLIALALAARMRTPVGRRVGGALLALVVLLNVAGTYSRMWAGRSDGMMRAGESYAAVQNSAWMGLPESETFARTDADISATGEMINGAALAGVAGTAVYNSTISGVCHRMMQDVANAGLVQINAIVGLDGRAALEAVWSVGQFVAADGDTRTPYGFELAGTTANGYALYENTSALPIGYAMTEAMSSEDYAQLSALDRQWALLQRAVLDEPSEAVAEAAPETSSYELSISSMEMENITATDGILTVEEGAVIRLTFDAPGDCELYLELEGLAYQDGLIDLGNRVNFSCGGQQSSICLMPSGFELDLLNRGSYLVNLGYDAGGRSQAEIRFARTGTYRLDGLKLYAQPMEDFAEKVAVLRERGLQNVSVVPNAVSGTIALEEPSVLVFSIPYSEGWTASVDGREVDTRTSAGTFLAVELDAGAHTVELTYRTPWLYEGCAISAVSVSLALTAIFAGRRKKLSRKELNDERSEK